MDDQMPDAGRQIQKLEFQEMLSSSRRKIKMSKNKTKMLKKEPKEKQRIKEK